MTHTARFVFSLPSSDAGLVAQSLSPELSQKIPKSNISFSFSKNELVLTITSDELSSLRAACNSYLRWIQTALAVKHLV
jgi:tRNA threonylcarbamoyladenosine modification (KEOPS) complex  Pcc1 subunit